jgi:hypothetical protein
MVASDSEKGKEKGKEKEKEKEKEKKEMEGLGALSGNECVYNYVVTAQKPTAVTHSVVGNFSDEKGLIYECENVRMSERGRGRGRGRGREKRKEKREKRRKRGKRM